MKMLAHHARGVLSFRELVFKAVSELDQENVFFLNKYSLPELKTNDILIMDRPALIDFEGTRLIITMMTIYIKYVKEIEGEEERAKKIYDHLVNELLAMSLKTLGCPTYGINFRDGVESRLFGQETVFVITSSFDMLMRDQVNS